MSFTHTPPTGRKAHLVAVTLLLLTETGINKLEEQVHKKKIELC